MNFGSMNQISDSRVFMFWQWAVGGGSGGEDMATALPYVAVSKNV
jgi:hypothetical protein